MKKGEKMPEEVREKLRAANVGKTFSEETRKKMSEGQRKRWDRGDNQLHSLEVRAKAKCRKMSDEHKAKIRAAHLGKTLSKEHREKIGAAQLGRTLPKEHREKISSALRGRKMPSYKLSEEGKERRLAGLRKVMVGKLHSEERKKKFSKTMKVWHEGELGKESAMKRAAGRRGKPQTIPILAKGPLNCKSIEGRLRDPNGKIWEFRNLTHFVREHGHLFTEEDVKWSPTGKVIPGKIPTMRCRASSGLLSLYGRIHSVGAWKGWTRADSQVELRDGGADLLGRDGSRIGQQSHLTTDK